MRHRSDATVFVDDYVQDRLPGICVVTGEPTNDRLHSETVVDRPSLGWLFLLLLGPIGWIVLLAVFAFGQRSYLHGELPFSEEAYLAEKRRTRSAVLFGIGAVVVAMAVFGAIANFSIGVVGVVLALIAGIGAYLWASSMGPALQLDASRRFVTIRKAHPNFAAAVREMEWMSARI